MLTSMPHRTIRVPKGSALHKAAKAELRYTCHLVFPGTDPNLDMDSVGLSSKPSTHWEDSLGTFLCHFIPLTLDLSRVPIPVLLCPA